MIAPYRRLARAWSLRRLWWRRSYWFRWAHKPLCDRFQRDVLSVGKVRLCRSCTLAWFGVAVGAVAMAIGGTSTAWSAVVLASMVVAASLPSRYARYPRWARDALRFSLGWVIGVGAVAVLIGPHLPGLLIAGGLAAAWAPFQASRRKRRQDLCHGCPQLGTGICSGFRAQAADARRYEEEATALLLADTDYRSSLPFTSSVGGSRSNTPWE